MARKNLPQKVALRALMSFYMKENNIKIKDGTDVNSIMRDMRSGMMEDALGEGLNPELGYSKYDYRNKETDNSRNSHSLHQIRNTTKFVSYKEIKPLMADLKRVYTAPTEEIALSELYAFDEKWNGKYLKIAKSWKDNWANLSTYFKYLDAVRKLIYTTNVIEGFNRPPCLTCPKPAL